VSVLVDARRLHELLAGDEPPVVLDVRWALGREDGGRALYDRGHVPGAVFVDLERELSAPPSREAGRHPLPPVEELEAAARRWGVRARSTVVAYDDLGNMSAARAWWLLRWGGLERVLLLDGGLQAWVSAGLPLETEPVRPAPGDVALTPGGLPVLDAEGAARVAAEGLLIDARAAERYRGDVEPVDPVAGHVPGAVSAPAAELVDADGRFAAPAELERRFRALGADGRRPVGVYCGSGVNAAHEVAALALAGFDAALYAGSWSQWCGDPSRPVATGPEP
jgi:thiosulfate/3-mercaptopyruvate sulfurtransferase